LYSLTYLLYRFVKIFSRKAAVVGAGLAANGGKGGARPRRGGAGLLRPGGPTNRPAYGGRAPRPQGAAVGRTAGKVDGAGRRLRCRQRMAVYLVV